MFGHWRKNALGKYLAENPANGRYDIKKRGGSLVEQERECKTEAVQVLLRSWVAREKNEFSHLDWGERGGGGSNGLKNKQKGKETGVKK